MASSSEKRAIALLIVIFMGVQLCSAEQYTVGGSSGWTFNVNYTKWASQYTFRVGDTLLFPYTSGEHDVVEVNASEYSSCSASTAIATYTETNSTVTLSSEGKHYYICSYTGHCSAGMLVEIDVLASSSSPSPSPSPSNSRSPSPSPSPSPSTSTTPTPSPTTTPTPATSPLLSITPSSSPSPSSPSALSPTLSTSPTPSPSTTASPSGTPVNSPSPTPSLESSPPNPSSPAPAPASSSAISTKWVASSLLLIASSLLFRALDLLGA